MLITNLSSARCNAITHAHTLRSQKTHTYGKFKLELESTHAAAATHNEVERGLQIMIEQTTRRDAKTHTHTDTEAHRKELQAPTTRSPSFGRSLSSADSAALQLLVKQVACEVGCADVSYRPAQSVYFWRSSRTQR